MRQIRSLVLVLVGRLRLDRQRVDGALEFRLQCRVYHSMAFNPSLPFEGRRHNIDPEMRLAALPVAGVALMQMLDAIYKSSETGKSVEIG